METYKRDPIAIVGIGCRFPGNIDSPADLYRFLTERRSAIREVPKFRWNADALYHPDPLRPGHIHVKKGGFIDAVDQFDAAFFGISPNEAKRMDPQQRLILETAFEAIEDAGARLEDLQGQNVAVVVGTSGADYESIQMAPTERANINGTTNTGLATSIVPNRVSYLFDLRGPSFSVDTACSSSLTALHHACRAVWEGLADAALVGGVNAILKPSPTMGFSKGMYLSPDGECRAFSDHANGYVRSEGAAMVYLKPLSRALADGDRVHAVIRGTWINQDGKTPGMTMPSQRAQEALLREAYRDAGVDPREVSYVEAHGTGTLVGDPIEATAIGRVVGSGRPPEQPCPMGSVKTNLGHMESAAGMAGLIKLALTLEHRTVFPNLNFRAPNPKIAFEALGVRVPVEPLELPQGRPLFGGVNSFGFGGANAHAVLETPPAARPHEVRPLEAVRPHVLMLSARSASALRTVAQSATLRLASGDLADVCDAYSRRKSRFEFRLAAVGDSKEKLIDAVKAHLDAKEQPGLFSRRATEGSREKVAFVFSGQGGQWWGMGRQLFAHEPLFRSTVERIDSELSALGFTTSLVTELHRDEASSRMGETQVAQPALFALEVGLGRLLEAHGVRPSAVVGHSIGELAAAHISGALTLEEATRIVFWRSRCQAQAEGKGAMAAIGVSEAEAKKLLAPFEGAVELAAINGPEGVTVAGTTPEVDRLVQQCEAQKLFVRRLNVSVPFHCALMDPIEADFKKSLSRVAAANGAVDFYSTVTAGRLDGERLDLDYWYRNIREPVRYHPAFTALVKDGITCFVELGPTASLKHGSTGPRVTYLGTLDGKSDERMCVARAVAQLFTCAVACEAEREARPFVELPPHPFERQSCWLETEAGRANRVQGTVHPHVERVEKRPKARDLFSATVVLDPRVEPYLNDHKVQGMLVFPGAGQLEVVQAAARAALGSDDVFLEDVELKLPMVMTDAESTTRFRLEVYSDEGHFQIASERDGQFLEHSRGRIQHGADRFTPAPIDLPLLRARIKRAVPLQALYAEAALAGLDFGPAFRGIQELWEEGGECLARIDLPRALLADATRFLVHPALIDSLVQTLALTRQTGAALALPHRVRRFQIHRPGYAGPLWAFAREGTVTAVDDSGQLVATIEGLELKAVQGSVRPTSATHPANHYAWKWEKVDDAAPLASRKRPEGTWVVLSDRTDFTPALPGGKVLRVSSEEHLRALPRLPAGEKVAGLVHAWLTGDEDLEQAERKGPLAAAQWVTALAQRFSAGAEVWLCARGLTSAPLWGFGRTLMSEQAHLQTTLVELEGQDVAPLYRQLERGPEHHELCLSPSGRAVHRLTRVASEGPRLVQVDAASEPFRAIVGTPGLFQSIALERQAERALLPDEVELQVRATGLNFKDVVVAMGFLPSQAWEHGLSAAELGIDCAGVVAKVGAAVRDLKAGDEVLGCAPACLGNRAVARRALLVPKPKGITFEQAAALPTVYCTAVLGLERLAQLQPDETVLIHAGAGGVGIAAIHVAKRIGARVMATTSTDEKRAFLRSLGVEHIFNSRGTDFREHVMAATGGRGVDVVLNSLTGKQLTQGLRCLAPFGRFIEIGKADLYANRQLGLEFFGENRSFHVLDVNRWVANRTEESGRHVARIMQRVASGELPLIPVRTFPVQEAAQAVQALAQGRQIGKIVVSVPAHGPIEVRASKRLSLDGDGTYLVMGGTQGFGLDVALRLCERGARHVVLASRGGAVDPARLTALRATGAKVDAVGCDASDRAQVQALVASLPGLKGVFHAAMVLDDAPVGQLDAARFSKVSRPKALGAWHLHQATEGLKLDHFVMFSSIASVVGTPGQANYAAANAFLDRLAEHRRAGGKRATTVAFGVLDAGVVARATPEQRRKIAGQGVGVFSVPDALDALEQALLEGRTHEVIAHVSWERLAALSRPDGRPPRFEGLTAKALAGSSADAGVREQLLLLPPDERAPFLAARIAQHVAAVVGLKEPADVETGLGRYGLDSLMSVQLQSWLQDRLGVAIPIMRILRGPSIRELSEQVIDAMAKGGAEKGHEWLKQVNAAAGQPTARLFCFSYMTADDDAYASWARSLDPSIELWRVAYPELGGAHDALLRGPSDVLRGRAADELAHLTDLPFAFYGHSMGGWVALDLAKELESRGQAPRFVAVGALPTHETMRSIMPTSSVVTPEEISEDLVVEVMNRMQVPAALIEQPAFRSLAIAHTRRDLWLGIQAGLEVEDRSATRLKSPLWLFVGSDDAMSTADEEAPDGLTPAGVVMVPGGHLFVEEPVASEQVARKLSGWLAEK